jgi:hypothetical protein
VGWSQTLHGSATITDEKVELILNTIKASHAIPNESWSRQQWGWSTECDIFRSYTDQTLFFSGASFSYQTKLPQRFAAAARLLGYRVRLRKREW